MLVRSVKVAKLQSRWPGCHDEIPFSFTHIHSSCAALPVRTRIHIFTSFLERKVFKDYKWRKAAKKTVYLSCTYSIYCIYLYCKSLSVADTCFFPLYHWIWQQVYVYVQYLLSYSPPPLSDCPNCCLLQTHSDCDKPERQLSDHCWANLAKHRS